MAADGIDISRKVRRQLTLDVTEEADKIIVMAEQETWPDFLKDSNKVEVWNITANLGTLDYEGFCEIRDQIKELVSDLVQQVG